ncbi:MAG: bifunctional demethylmenaquinone methyltransferase/2-methoxy-6-polyprenyl-1,4-benzoquinol methylase UbiE [Granulosicoccaceae bacterium]|jgi:demethylmenaquinone methyltransferase/2-methoxy-6-polyprenyl-1,4-benzoquinol methylase
MNDKHTDHTTHFGFEQVKVEDKVRRVRGVFDSVASNYDIMNDVMSMGVHRLWKRVTVEVAALRAGQQILDLAGGTGDLTRLMSERVGPTGKIVISDINGNMLSVGRDTLINSGHVGNIEYVQANAEVLPFPDNQFHCVTIGFGLRNVTDKDRALREMYRVLKPGGKLLVLEFSKPTNPALAKIYDVYSFKLLPLMGRFIANDEASYRYLAESIRMHPDQETLKDMMVEAGFERCEYLNMTGGIVALHKGYKI